MENDIFDSPKKGDRFLTRNGKVATYVELNHKGNENAQIPLDRLNVHCLTIEGIDGYAYYHDDGLMPIDHQYDIISEYTPRIEFLNRYDTITETTARNRMGCDESWYDSWYAIKNTFSKEDIENMTDAEFEHLDILANKIAVALY